MNTTDKRTWVILLALVLIAAVFNHFRANRVPDTIVSNVESLRDKELVYTKHARCRMDCRTISREEVESVLATGRVNQRKSDPNDKPCPTYALEDYTEDGQLVRIVFASCDRTVKVVTAIDLKNEYKCHCN